MHPIFVLILILLFKNEGFGQLDKIREGAYYTFSLNNEISCLKGKVKKNQNGIVTIRQLNSKATIKIASSQIVSVLEIFFAKSGSVGLGLGIPYGMFGLNGEFNLIDYFSLSGGIGTTVFAGMGYCIGAKLYAIKAGEKFRPRFSVFYGINSMIIILDEFNNVDVGEAFSGISMGLGFCQMIFGKRRNHGFDVDLIYFVTQNDFQNRKNELINLGYDLNEGESKFGLSIGYRFAF